MNNVSSINSLKTGSPKTPGGISKSLLTPCRRLGLSRNYKKAGPAPFISPISDNNSTKVMVKVEKKEPRKRKKSLECEKNKEGETASKTPIVEDGIVGEDEGDLLKPVGNEKCDLTSTPTSHIEVPRKKKSKTLLTTLNKSNDDKTPLTKKQSDNLLDTSSKVFHNINTDEKEDNVVPLKNTKSMKSSPRQASKDNSNIDLYDDTVNLGSIQKKGIETDNIIVTPLQKARTRSNISKNYKNNVAPQKSPRTLNENVKDAEASNNIIDSTKRQVSPEEKTTYCIKPRSPNELTKECIVIIQKKIFKTDKNNLAKNKVTQDSDSDELPLSEINKEKIGEDKAKINKYESKEQKPATSENEIINLNDENEDFVETKNIKVKKLEDKATSIGGLKKNDKMKKPKAKTQKPIPVQNIPDFDDEDDFDFENKKTILIRKTYEKVSKPQKAKSTGSITQRDIDELKARIEAKKKLLIARAMTEDTEELRFLIKKWQRGCQDALMELMDLMKKKFPDKQNMDYSEMLSLLKIPTNLVGYDEENDCFNTPDDANIVLSKFNDL